MVISGSCRSNDSFTGRLRRRYCCHGSAPATEAKTEAAGSKTEEAQAEDGKTEAAAPEAGADVAGKTVAFVPKLTGNAFFESANNGAQEYSKGWGFTVDYQAAPMQRLQTRLT